MNCMTCRYYEQDVQTWPCTVCDNFSKYRPIDSCQYCGNRGCHMCGKGAEIDTPTASEIPQQHKYPAEVKFNDHNQSQKRWKEIVDAFNEKYKGLITAEPIDSSVLVKDFGGIKDSGTRTEFDTGAVRDGRTGKGRFDLLPVLSLFRLAKHYERGCLKYGDRNWERGIPISKYIDSCIRHLLKYILGMTDEHHLASALWNIAGAMETLDRIELGLLPSDLDDLPYSFADIDVEKIEALLDEIL